MYRLSTIESIVKNLLWCTMVVKNDLVKRGIQEMLRDIYIYTGDFLVGLDLNYVFIAEWQWNGGTGPGVAGTAWGVNRNEISTVTSPRSSHLHNMGSKVFFDILKNSSVEWVLLLSS